MSKQKRRIIPRFVAEQYAGGSRGFKAKKRKLIREALRAIEALRLGCAWFPGGAQDVNTAARALGRVKENISVKVWGR